MYLLFLQNRMQARLASQLPGIRLTAVLITVALLSGCLDLDTPEPVLLGDHHEFPANPEQLSNDYYYRVTVRQNGTTQRDEAGWMRQSVSSPIDASDNQRLSALWEVREDYYPDSSAPSYSRHWKLGHDSTDRVWTRLAFRSTPPDGEPEWHRYSAEGAGEQGLIFSHVPMAEGETYPAQRIRWPDTTNDQVLDGTVSVQKTERTRTRAGTIESYRFNLAAQSQNRDTVLSYRYWINPKLGIVREIAVLEEPDGNGGFVVTNIERELENYYHSLD